METKILEELGLNKSEVRVYLKLLELGSTRTGELTSRANVSRSKIYEILEKLMQKGLASYVIKENTKYFEASDPMNLTEYIERKKKDLKRQSEELNKIIPLLVDIQKEKKEHQTATIFEGYNGLKTLFNGILNTLKKGEEYYAYGSSEEQYTKEFSIFIMNYHKKREEKRIRVKLLVHNSLKNRVVKELNGYKQIKFGFTKEHSPTGTLIYKDNVFIFIWKNQTAFLIHSKTVADEYKTHFMDIWDRSEHYSR